MRHGAGALSAQWTLQTTTARSTSRCEFLGAQRLLLLAQNSLAPHNASCPAGPVLTPLRNIPVLTESEVSRSWNKLFKSGAFTEATFERAEALLDELRGTSPLRHRLQAELEELRELHGAQVQA
jgi:hypothetical protein